MTYATTAGAEVQRPLATVVIVGILVGTVVTLTVLPGMLWTLAARRPPSGPGAARRAIAVPEAGS